MQIVQHHEATEDSDTLSYEVISNTNQQCKTHYPENRERRNNSIMRQVTYFICSRYGTSTEGIKSRGKYQRSGEIDSNLNSAVLR